jgi:hypothetical protein
LLLALNCVPLIHVLIVVGLLVIRHGGWPARIGAGLAALYLLPPLMARLILFPGTFPQGRFAIGSRPFFRWWSLFQLQIIFCRLPALEEILRLVPGLYSFWLRLWGARIGRLTYWSPGTTITDRSFLAIGNDVVFGAGVRLNAHVLAKNQDGRDAAHFGAGESRRSCGRRRLFSTNGWDQISPGEITRACLLSPPFSLWKDGKRIKHGEEFE